MPPEPDDRVLRFGCVQRVVHRTTACLMLICLVTAACLYLGPLAQLVGRRHIVAAVHEWSGISLPLPTLLGLIHPSFRADLQRLNRFAVYDRQWLRAVRRRRTSPQARPAGKFNAGQKIFAGWIAGAVVVMMLTGLLMWFSGALPAISRTSAIFVHDWLAWMITAVIIGHVRKAHKDPEARLGMRSGYVSAPWAVRNHPRWQPEREMEITRKTSLTGRCSIIPLRSRGLPMRGGDAASDRGR
ncbi:cytochrome b/b6 domain-containing protein [Streptomyces sp. SID5789]|uniref:cytochrome b/b6 domain-containing protein n=1 Tax=Streptomyces sp. SID5789 TaxID=2690310 RepID=UPI00136EACCA|nr:cytochrome b/b6 domain-containing protein [Streptomyces sp. SID5789]MZE68804.1 formate dehydrogenase [Streptomyces sp. SID5789]